MSGWHHELRLILRSRLSMAALVLLFLLAALAVGSGLREVHAQRGTIARLGELQQKDLAALAARYAGGDAGYAAYYTFHATWDPPSDAAFLALGLRDVAPHALRVRALGLQAQLYEGETFNPELALTGRFDYSFVLIYLAPLFVIALLHDLFSGERQAGRLRVLQAMPGGTGRLWLRRAALRLLLVLAALALPLTTGAVLSGSIGAVVATALLATVAQVAFWGGLSLLVASRRWSSTAHATALVGTWVALTLALPACANLALARAIPVDQGVDLMLTQRQNVHAAWEVPRDQTMQKFFQTHPAWKDTPPLPAKFHWKWYFAFHQLGDESVAGDVAAYRDGLEARQRWTDRLGHLLPGVGAQAVLHRIAGTDLPAQLAYLDRVADFHRQVRTFYYPFIFNERPMGRQDFANLPRFHATAATATGSAGALASLLAWGIAALGLAALAVSRPGAGG